MAEQYPSLQQLAQRPQQSRTRERLKDPTEDIWNHADSLVELRIQQAMKAQQDKGEQATPLSAEELARSLQLRYMHTSDTDEWPTGRLTANRVALLLLGIPAAARAQERLDTHSSRDPALDVHALSRFNRDLSDSLMIMPSRMMPGFADGLRRRSQDQLYRKWGMPILNEVQFNRITNGISHEVAVVRALQQTLPEGWQVRQGTLQEDKHGTDAIVIDDQGRELRLDSKTSYAFDRTVGDLESGHWITRQAATDAYDTGVVYSPGRLPTGEKVYTCVFDADNLGTIKDYQYEDPSAVFEFVERQFDEQGQGRLRKLGRHAITT